MKKLRKYISHHHRLQLKARICFIFALALIFITYSTASAIVYSGSSETWSETFSYSPQYNYDPPEEIGTSITVIDDGPGAMMFKVGLAASVYQFNAYGPDYNYVHLRVAAVFESLAVGNFLPVHADQIIICIQKNGYYDEQAVEVQDSGVIPYSQGMRIVQPSGIVTPSSFGDRSGLAGYTVRKALSKLLGYIPGWDVVDYLINLADAFDGTSQDYNHAYFGSDTMAYCWWTAEPFDFGTMNPIDQYCFNTLFWIHERDNPGAGGYGIDVWAKVKIDGSAVGYFDNTWYYTPKLYLRIIRKPSGGGGGWLP